VKCRKKAKGNEIKNEFISEAGRMPENDGSRVGSLFNEYRQRRFS
jgi:hypothetical protein